jgi:hypothetical protein
MEHEVCVFVETPPQYLKLYKTIKDYDKCNASKIVVVGNRGNQEDEEQYSRLREIYDDVEVEFIDKNKDNEKAEELLEKCKKARHLIILISGGLK